MDNKNSQKQVGAGSLWNINSWHWEQKDYTQVVKQLITDAVTKIEIEQDGIKLINKAIKTFNGNAEINIRKGKQIVIYDISLEVEWFGESRDAEAKGTFKVDDINPDDLDFTIDHIKSDEKTDISKDCEKIIKKEMKKHFDKFLSTLVQDLFAKIQTNTKEALEEDARKREEVAENIRKAREQNGQYKQQIFEEQRQKEQQMKQQYSNWKE
ncbi:Activator of Hsp90 ATPase, N-terminal [Pseudocohnilembus persalinus]|uniref:Activator of Hsp90 ATPase, N-terminal n=1 Tax=Pseudocohnilembus persalinus TaxID=266149 RepID=A0A0V0QXK5_PSEPJ|nr:Activator of Hsp90 ATPase, N-terminal [Pseudocohnilembus persalinus]|eukprot:KRX06966.1 Activator of Hsp90 ATPase, N-terminal [Pseudocohnilembus persalinus]